MDYEERLSLASAAAELPILRGTNRPSRRTLWRWATSGLQTRDGRRIYLETEFVGGTLCTTRAAIDCFVAAKSTKPQRPGDVLNFDRRNSVSFERRAGAAIDRLKSKGIL
jgi:hypothetical protein